jgi:NitT/TauT family transport system substrate-binding protein
MKMQMHRFIFSLLGAVLLFALSVQAQAEMSKITIAREYGVSYLPMMLMQEDKLVEKHAKAEGIDNLEVDWVQFAGGNVMNDALLSDSLQFASGGVGPMVKIWAKTKGNMNVRAVSALNAMPLYLNTRNPNIKTVKDFTEKDKIALPAVKVSIQAVTLQMAAAQAFGDAHYDQLDKYTVSMSHPDGMIALLSGAGEINSHFNAPPFQYKELENPAVHTMLSSYDVLGGPATFNVIWTTDEFRQQNPKIYNAFTAALAEAIVIINRDKLAAAKLYIRAAKSNDSVDFIYKILSDPKVEFTMTPKNTTKYSDFLFKVGAIKVKPASWKDMFFPNVYNLPGS